MIGAAALAIVIGTGMPEVFALGFKNPDQNARATGQGEAFVAQADDASAIYYNPGGLTQIQGTEVTGGGMLTFPDFRLKGAGSGAEMNSMSFIPHLYISTDFGASKSPWRFGVGVNVPYGNRADYAPNGPFRYIVTSDALQVINIQPTVAYKFNEHFSLGAGLNIYDAYTGLNSHVPAAPLPDGHAHFNGDGLALGATAGLMWKITPQHTIGLVYRSPFTVTLKGNADVSVPPIIKTSNSGQTSIPFPQSVAVGYAFRPVPKLKLEADVEWTDWNTLNSVVVHAPGSGLNGETIHFNWMDSFFYEFGVQYDVNQHWTVRGGYIYSQNTVPNSSFSPTLPDYERHIFSVGLGYTTPRFSVDVAYQYSYSPDRTVSSSPARIANGLTAADGTWETSANALLLTTSVKF
jgi:long-chain fatty acid transport protein